MIGDKSVVFFLAIGCSSVFAASANKIPLQNPFSGFMVGVQGGMSSTSETVKTYSLSNVLLAKTEIGNHSGTNADVLVGYRYGFSNHAVLGARLLYGKLWSYSQETLYSSNTVTKAYTDYYYGAHLIGGYQLPTTLFYLFGGPIFSKNTDKISSSILPNQTVHTSGTNWMVGLGVEQKIVAGLHLFGEMNYTFVPNETVVIANQINKASGISRLGLNLGVLYQF